MVCFIPQAVERVPGIYHGNGHGLFGCNIGLFFTAQLDFGIIYIVKVLLIMFLGEFGVGVKYFLKSQVQAVQYIIISLMGHDIIGLCREFRGNPVIVCF